MNSEINALWEDEEALLWDGGFKCWEPYQAGYIDFPEALYIFYMLWADAKEVVEELAR